MRVTQQKRYWPLLSKVLFGIAIVGHAQASDQSVLIERAQSCLEETSRLARLNCYDAVFVQESTDQADSELPELWHAIAQQEAIHRHDQTGVIVQTHEGSVLMSAPALGTTPPRPLLVMACEQKITRLQLHVPEPLSGDSRLSIELDTGSTRLTQLWRVRDGGYILSGGRGLPAIGTLQQLLNTDTLTLHSESAYLNGLRFNVQGLRQSIQPLRDECRW